MKVKVGLFATKYSVAEAVVAKAALEVCLS